MCNCLEKAQPAVMPLKSLQILCGYYTGVSCGQRICEVGVLWSRSNVDILRTHFWWCALGIDNKRAGWKLTNDVIQLKPSAECFIGLRSSFPVGQTVAQRKLMLFPKGMNVIDDTFWRMVSYSLRLLFSYSQYLVVLAHAPPSYSPHSRLSNSSHDRSPPIRRNLVRSASRW